jgi:glutamyl/glutaminyl-tRNA synthetase
MSTGIYRGRLAPSPTGYLHVGHARTFWIAQCRARAAGGKLVLRSEDLDRTRVRPEFATAMLEDLRWLGLEWAEGPDIGGPFAPYEQSARLPFYRSIFQHLKATGFLYPCTCSRQDVLRALNAPHAGEEEPIYPGTCRNKEFDEAAGTRVSWRFQVPEGSPVSFIDLGFGRQEFVAGCDFGDFVVWRPDDVPAYQLACVADDHAMQITEVVRGADLLMSTARQILLFAALGYSAPAFYHCPLMTDDKGVRLAKRNDALSLRALRAGGKTPQQIVEHWTTPN